MGVYGPSAVDTLQSKKNRKKVSKSIKELEKSLTGIMEMKDDQIDSTNQPVK